MQLKVTKNSPISYTMASYNFLLFYTMVSYIILKQLKGLLMERQLYRYNPWWEEEFNPPGILERKRYIATLTRYFERKEIKFLMGLRRVGKTTLMKLLIRYLIQHEITKPQNILYVSLDDYLLEKYSLLDIVDEFRKIQRLSFSEKVYLFFDEVASKKDFEIQLKNLYDAQNVQIVASSSSSSVLRRKKPFLTGRSIVVEIAPLDFEEYLMFKGIQLKKGDAHLVDQYFEDFLLIGGIPEYVLRGDHDYLRELVDDIIYKDIAAFHGIKNQKVLKEYFLLMMERVGKSLSINKVADILDIYPDTAKRYLEMFMETFLIHLLPRCGKTNERILSPKKVYAADLGIRNLFTGFRDKGSLFENYVYLTFKHKDLAYVYRDGIELDFMTGDKILIEVKYGGEMTPKQQKLFDATKATKKFVIRSYGDLATSRREING